MKKAVFRRFAAILAAVVLLPGAARAVPQAEERITVLIGAEDASVLDGIPGAVLIADFFLTDTVAAEISAADLPLLSDYTVTEAGAIPAPSAVTVPKDAQDWYEEDNTYRAEDPLAGDGTVIAVIDTGMELTHPAFSLPAGATPSLRRAEIEKRMDGTHAAEILYELYEEADLSLLYHSEKIPFFFDYASNDADISSPLVSHGTHVAALAAGGGTAEGTLPGAAPAAQLLLMKVFDDAGISCSEISLIRAVEDAVLLGADVINLSLGTPATTAENKAMFRLYETIRAAEACGVVVVCAGGNDGMVGAGGLYSDYAQTDNPDTGLPSEPSVMAEALAVGAMQNGITFVPYLTVSDTVLLYDLPAEATEGKAPAFGDVFAGQSLNLVSVPGVGERRDYASLNIRGKVAVVSRGTISFEDKVKNAAAAGAVAIIIHNTEDGADFLMTVGTGTIPAISVSYDVGMFLRDAGTVGLTLNVPTSDGAFTPVATGGIASFSSRGPSAEITLGPDLVAIGQSVVSAVPGEAYASKSGTSMAAPQIAGIAAAYISEHSESLSYLPTEDVAARVRAALMSAALPLRNEDGVALSPRAQGAGALVGGTDVGEMRVVLTGERGRAAVELGDGAFADGTATFPVTVAVTEGDALEMRFSAEVLADGYEERDGVLYTTDTPVTVPAKVRFSAPSVTLAADESETVTVTVTVDEEFLKEQSEAFPNGFYIEGYITAELNGAHMASLPFLAFCGEWDDAPILGGGDWDGNESYYGGQSLLWKDAEEEAHFLGEDSSLFAFSPNGDGVADTLYLRLFPLRHIDMCHVMIYDADGELVCQHAYSSMIKSYVSDYGLIYHEPEIWDGTDGLNERYIWEDGDYTAEVTVYLNDTVSETLVIPITLDTERPKLTVSASGGVLTATATDGGALRSLRIYTGNPTADAEAYIAEISAETADETDAWTLTAEIPAAVPYLYIRAEDAAGNVTIIRYYAEGRGAA